MKKPDYEEQFGHYTSTDFLTVGKQSYDSPWLKYVGGLPVVYYDECATEGTCLRLQCEKTGDSVSCASVWTKGIRTFTDGKIEVRARFHGGNSSWPAIWLKSTNSQYEIDLCEYFEQRDCCKTGIFMPKHLKWGLNRLFRPKKHPKINKGGWNTFTCEWDSRHIALSVNGRKVIDYKNKANGWKSFPLTSESRKFYLILSMQYGKKWLKKEKHSQLPLWMDIDYVKWWKKE